MTFQQKILQGLAEKLPAKRTYSSDVNHAPKRKDVLNKKEKQLALRNALRYFPSEWHQELAQEFAQELQEYGRIYMYRFKPDYRLYARPINEYPAQSQQAAAIMLMIQNNLDPANFAYVFWSPNGFVPIIQRSPTCSCKQWHDDSELF